MAWLKPAKTITDPVHQDIYLSRIEQALVDSRPMQRLRNVKQLGMTRMVYPGAEHSRFSHLLGTMQSAQLILDKVRSSSDGPHATSNLLAEWTESGPDVFDLKWAEATVLARLAALIHDLTHVPFGHTIEDDLGILQPHDENNERFKTLWAIIPEEPRVVIENALSCASLPDREDSLFAELKAIVLDKHKKTQDHKRPALYPFVADVVNNTICADLIDYIDRDHRYLGLPFAVGDRFMDSFHVVPAASKSEYRERLVVRLHRDGETRQDVHTEIVKYLRYRYEETERALYHKTKLAHDALLGKMLEMWKDSRWYEEALKIRPQLRGNAAALDAAWLRNQFDHQQQTAISRTVRDETERMFLSFGDEGLLEHLIWELSERSDLDERELGVLDLAERIRYREHFPQAGQASGRDLLAVAGETYKKFRTADARRALEMAAADFVGLTPRWQVLLWVPAPSMRLKIAEVLVEDLNGIVAPLAKTEHGGPLLGDREAASIVEKHMQLWALRVFLPSELQSGAPDIARVVLGFLQEEIGVPLVGADGSEIPALSEQAAAKAGDEESWSSAQRQWASQRLQLVAAAGRPTWAQLLAAARQLDPPTG